MEASRANFFALVGLGCGTGECRGLVTGKVARNSIGRSFNKVGKRCNSNDRISEFERDVGELRAKLRVGSGMRGVRAGGEGRGPSRCLAAVPVGGGGAWLGFKPTRRTAEQRPGPTGVEGAGGTGGHGRASRCGTERSEVA